MNSNAVDESLRSWATGHVLVRRLWVFGSRARGDHRTDSDLDVAIEIHHHDESNGLATWMFETQHWAYELAALSPFSVDFQQYQGPVDTPVIDAGLARSSRLVFERA
ncbi:putative nucleotidyltransferase [Variovorax boronicumulans]|uniref:nucleotidyltransferase family protein n=1 Tax=Variovorax boronicumulans TaxID=436515 RepID=UPI00277D1F17|nr:nucleotidyltransferase domain-containing protein [Variovorax boronicumulans]MDP9908930.1 putative nucleotidyltransferase [Variovorax boronicumulans]